MSTPLIKFSSIGSTSRVSMSSSERIEIMITHWQMYLVVGWGGGGGVLGVSGAVGWSGVVGWSSGWGGGQCEW